MKKYFILFAAFLVLGLTSCSSTMWLLKTDCNVSNEILFEDISSILKKEGFLILQNTGNTLEAKTLPERNAYGFGYNYWNISVIDHKLVASAYWYQYVNGTEQIVYVNDDKLSDRKNTWYWRVRNQIQNLCKNKIVFEIYEKEKI